MSKYSLRLPTLKVPSVCCSFNEHIQKAASSAQLIVIGSDFNPIENAFSKLKALLRAKAERTVSALWDAVAAVLDLFTPNECANYFKAAGYEPD